MKTTTNAVDYAKFILSNHRKHTRHCLITIARSNKFKLTTQEAENVLDVLERTGCIFSTFRNTVEINGASAHGMAELLCTA